MTTTTAGREQAVRSALADAARRSSDAAYQRYISGLRNDMRAEVTATRKAIASYRQGLDELRADHPDDYVIAALTNWTMRGLAADIEDHRARVGMYSAALCGEAAAAQLLGRDVRP